MKTCLIFLLLAFTKAFTQADSVALVIHKDPRIDMLVRKQIEINEITTRNARRFVQGYRILVTSTNNRSKALEAKSKIYQSFPDLKAYLMYQAPYFKLKVGNFKDRKEAEIYLNDIKYYFPTGVYIIRDIIEVKPEKYDEID